MNPIELNLPRFEYRTEDGITAVREGFVVVFFIPQEEAQKPSAVAEAAMRYLGLAGVPNTLAAVDDDDQAITYDPAAIAALVRDAAQSAEEIANVVVHDLGNPDSGYSLTYFHIGRRRAVSDGWPNAGGGLRFCFPYEFAGPSVLLQLREFADNLAALLPFSSAYVAPAFLYDEGVYKSPAFDTIRGLSKRYLCLDIPDLVVDCFEVASGVKGAYWGNYLSEALVAELGGVETVALQLSAFETRVRRISGALALYLNTFPVAGDVNRQESVLVYQAAAKLLSPCIRAREVAYSGFSDEDMSSWLHRFGRFELPEEEDQEV
jgi:hypothetical protein